MTWWRQEGRHVSKKGETEWLQTLRWSQYCRTCRRPQGQSFYHVSNGLNPPISDYWHPKSSSILGNLVHRCTLGPSACHHCTLVLVSYKLRFISDFKWCKWTLEWISLPFTVPSWVMQMEPQPMPTLRASTPASMRFFAWAAVTTRGRQMHTKNQCGSGAFERDGEARAGCYRFHLPPGVQDISAWCSL